MTKSVKPQMLRPALNLTRGGVLVSPVSIVADQSNALRRLYVDTAITMTFRHTAQPYY